MLDPSELLRPEPDFMDKGISKFRDYTVDEADPLKEMVRKTYKLMHSSQTVDFGKRKFMSQPFMAHCASITLSRTDDKIPLVN